MILIYDYYITNGFEFKCTRVNHSITESQSKPSKHDFLSNNGIFESFQKLLKYGCIKSINC